MSHRHRLNPSQKAIGAAGDERFSLADHTRDNLGGGRTITNEARALAGKENGGLDIARIAGRTIARLLGPKRGGKLDLAPMPRAREAIGDGATGVPRGPIKSANDVEDLGPQRVVSRGLEDALLQHIAAKCFEAGEETGSDKAPLRLPALVPQQVRGRRKRRLPQARGWGARHRRPQAKA
jgi:hypothetical protein